MNIFYFFGDSVTLGVNDASAGGWVARLAGMAAAQGLQVPPDTFYNLGARKHSSAMIMQRWEGEYLARAIEGVCPFLIFCFGTVDMASPKGAVNISTEESASHAREILQKAKTYGKAALISAPPVKDAAHCARLESLCAAYASVCTGIGVPFIDIFHPLLQNGYVNDLADGVHPGSAGNNMIAHEIIKAAPLKQWFCQGENNA